MIPKLVGHRGYMAKYPENSLPGIEAALKAGACMVEFDVQMSADHELVVHHDSNLQRTAGIVDSIFDLTASELSKISIHEPERFGDKFIKTLLPTLTQVLELVADYPKATAFIEIKHESIEKWGLEYVISGLMNLLQPYASQCVIISFNASAIEYVKKRGHFRTGWVLKNFNEEAHIKADQLNPEYLICNQKKISNDVELWQGGWSWMLYDITNPDRALQWAARGAELIETADIGSMLEHDELRKESC